MVFPLLVPEGNLFSTSTMKVKIINCDGKCWVGDIQPDCTVDALKMLAIENFSKDGNSAKKSVYHQLVDVKSGRKLDDTNSVRNEGISKGDELILIKKRLQPPEPFVSTRQKEEKKKGPDATAITAATKNIPLKNKQTTSFEEPSGDFQSDLHSILVTLLDSAQRILCLDSKAASILKEAEEIMNTEPSDEMEADPFKLQKLKEMGFSEVRATKALLLNKMNVTQAMDWLFQHETDPDVDKPITKTNSKDEKSSDEKDSTATDTSAAGTPHKKVNILESFRAFKKREFKPNPKSVLNLVEMGFEQKVVIEALRFTRNNEGAACELLLGDRQLPQDSIERDNGLDPNSSLYKAIMNDPVVQEGINNPKCLLAFLSMLENPNSTAMWLTDMDTAPMFVQISRIYNAERHTPRT